MVPTAYLIPSTIRISKGKRKATQYFVYTPEQYERYQDQRYDRWARILAMQITNRHTEEQKKRPDEIVSLNEVLDILTQETPEEAEAEVPFKDTQLDLRSYKINRASMVRYRANLRIIRKY